MKRLGYLLLFILLILIDQISKYWVMTKHIFYDNGSFFGIELSFNRGISLGLFHSENNFWFSLLLLVIALTLIMFLWYTYQMYQAHYQITAYVFVAAGAISNFIDRLHYGKVIDFILFYWKSLSFPVFNVADCWIFLGVFYILCFQYQDSCRAFSKK
jgi:signal peptidase II